MRAVNEPATCCVRDSGQPKKCIVDDAKNNFQSGQKGSAHREEG